MYKLLILIYINYAAAFQSRIVNGTDAAPGQVGYIVSLQEYDYHTCGGSIIDQNNVITAAHCLQGDILNYRIQYGVLEIVPNDVNVIQVRKAFIHESFNPRVTAHDIAILRLSSPLPLNSISVRPIPLPTQGEEFRAYSWAFTAGWGSVQGDASEHLQTTSIHVLSPNECRSAYGWRFREEDHLCVGNIQEIRRGTCKGDSGSPLIVVAKLAGLSSWSFKVNDTCALKEYPDVFTKVSHYVNWIEEQVSKI